MGISTLIIAVSALLAVGIVVAMTEQGGKKRKGKQAPKSGIIEGTSRRVEHVVFPSGATASYNRTPRMAGVLPRKQGGEPYRSVVSMEPTHVSVDRGEDSGSGCSPSSSSSSDSGLCGGGD